MGLTVYITTGLPGSGKSYWAKQLLEENKGRYKNICKDDLRVMLDNGDYSNSNEAFVVRVRDMIILAALEEGKHVIVSDTNLAEKHISHIKELVKGRAIVEVVDFTSVPLETCIERDLKRFNSVGETVIRDMYTRYLSSKTNTECGNLRA